MKSISISSFVKEFMVLGTYDASSEPITMYITPLLYISLILIVITFLGLTILLRYKEKPWKIYLYPLIGYSVYLLIAYATSSYFTSYNGVFDAATIRIYRDMFIMIHLSQLPIFVLLFIRILGIDLNKFDFKNDEDYLDYLKTGEKGVFVLLRTSNEGAKDIECLDYNGEALYFKVGDELKKFADELTSECGYSPLGFVVGATHSEEAKKIRERYKNIFFLLPGYGAQGAKAEDIRTYLNDFNGGVVNSSRGIIKYYQKFEDGEERFAHYTREAVLNMRKDIYGE